MNSTSMDSVRIFNKPTTPDGSLARLPQYFGQNVFDIAAMAKRLAQKDVETIKSIMQNGGKIDTALAARVATAVSLWGKFQAVLCREGVLPLEPSFRRAAYRKLSTRVYRSYFVLE